MESDVLGVQKGIGLDCLDCDVACCSYICVKQENQEKLRAECANVHFFSMILSHRYRTGDSAGHVPCGNLSGVGAPAV